MDIEEVNGNVSFEESEAGVIMFISFSHPTKTTESGFPLTLQCNFDFNRDTAYYESVESFFK